MENDWLVVEPTHPHGMHVWYIYLHLGGVQNPKSQPSLDQSHFRKLTWQQKTLIPNWKWVHFQLPC